LTATLRVADFSSHVSGPTTSLFLRAVGAEVVKVENPAHGDGNRQMAASPQIDGGSIYHHALNWGAKSVIADPRAPDWAAWVSGMTGWADVVIVSGRPSDVRRLGLDRASVGTANARAIHCHISGYGPSGPWAERAAHGQNPDALAGLFDLEVDEHGRPHPLPWRAVGTSLAGVMGALGVFAALWRRAETGEVLAVETSLWESAIWWNWRQLTALANLDEDWGRVRDFGSRYSTYATADQRALLIAPVEEKFWRAFCEAAGVPDHATTGDWRDRYDFGELALDGAERAWLSDVIARHPLDWWITALEPSGVPFCEVLSPKDVLAAPQLAETAMLVDLERGGTAIRPPIRLVSDDGPCPLPGTALPTLGQDTEAFRSLLGL
jgi:crotonobetainyl-CoA:carnitine CoA-transferase CaiB-like acyl-CoA transferase